MNEMVFSVSNNVEQEYGFFLWGLLLLKSLVFRQVYCMLHMMMFNKPIYYYLLLLYCD